MKPDNAAGADAPPTEQGAGEETFGQEVKALLGGLGWGVRWLGLSLAWGLSLFALVVMIGYAIWGGLIDKPGPYYGLLVVVGLLTVILSVLRQRAKGD